MNILTDPYAKDTVTKTTVNPGSKDISFIHGLHSRRGTMQLTINHLVSKLVYELKRNGFTHYDPDRYAAAISGLSITLGTQYVGYSADNGGPPAVVQEPQRDVGPGTPTMARPAVGEPLQPLKARKRNASNRKGKTGSEAGATGYK